MRRYAESTQVPVERSRAEIEKLITRFGAARFAYGWQEAYAIIGFEFQSRAIRMKMPLPQPDDEVICLAPSGRARAKADLANAMATETRRRWRSLALIVKAKLEAVSSGIVSFDHEWLAYTVMPNGQTVGDAIVPQLNEATASGKMPRLLLAE